MHGPLIIRQTFSEIYRNAKNGILTAIQFPGRMFDAGELKLKGADTVIIGGKN